MTDAHRPSAGSASERKLRALRDYDAWVEADLRPRRPRIIYVSIATAVAAMLIICAALAFHGSDDEGRARLANDVRKEEGGNDAKAERVAANDVTAQVLSLVRQLPIKEHVEVARAIGNDLCGRLLTPAQEWMRRKPAGARTGVNRILNRGPLDGLISIRGGGAYFSFSKRSNSYDDSPQLGMEQWKFTSGFAGSDCGLVEPVPVKVQSVDTVSLSTFPSYFKQPAREFYQWLRQQRATPATVVVGSVFLVRAVQWRDSDVLAAFEVLEKDAYGVTIAWKVLDEKPAPNNR